LGRVESGGERVDDRHEVVELVLQLIHGDGRVVGRLCFVAQPRRRQLDRQPAAAGLHEHAERGDHDAD
jgi:hypothetical protein